MLAVVQITKTILQTSQMNANKYYEQKAVEEISTFVSCLSTLIFTVLTTNMILFFLDLGKTLPKLTDVTLFQNIADVWPFM